MEWQPIATAPKDGTDVLVYLEPGGQPIVHIAFYRSEKEWHESGRFCGWESLEYWLGWWSYTANSVSQEKLEGFESPTHWLPLPPNPS